MFKFESPPSFSKESENKSSKKEGNKKESKKTRLKRLMPDFLKQKLALKQIKEKGFESFDDFRIDNITVEQISKVNKPIRIRPVGDMLGIDVIREEIRGTIIIESPLLGDNPVQMVWQADVETYETGLVYSVVNLRFYWGFSNEPFQMFYSVEKDPYIPHEVIERGKLFGLSKVRSYSHYTGSDYLAKEYFISLSEKVFKEIEKYIEKYAIPNVAVQNKFKNATFDIKAWASSKTEKELQEELSLSLEKGEVDGKFLYIMGGAEKFLQVMESEEYQVASTEFKILEENLEEVSHNLPPNIYDLGSGDGSKAKLILKKQLEQGQIPEYHPIDISPHMVFMAATHVPEKVKTKGYILDFTKPLKDKISTDKNIGMLLLGNTLGNGDLNYQKKIMNNISEAMKESDKLLVGVQLNYDLEEIYKSYNTPQNIEFARPMLRELGIKYEDAEIFISMDKEKSQISLNIKILKDVNARVGDKRIFLPAGKVIKLIISHKYQVGEMGELAREAKLKIQKEYQDENNTYALFLLEK